jgi:molecular chaperone DnaK
MVARGDEQRRVKRLFCLRIVTAKTCGRYGLLGTNLEGDVGYSLGIDVGTTYSAAAISRDGAVEVCTLGTTSQSIPSIVVLRDDGEILTGEAAERRAPGEPTRTAREFKRRLGDPVPIIIGTTPYGAEALMAFLIRDIVTSVSAREGSMPDVVVLTHPANYSDYKRDLLAEAARLAGLDLARVRFVSEPQAAAVAYASQRRVEPGEIVAVYDFGGGTFDAAVVRKDAGHGFTLLGNPEGMERLGGIDIDQAVFAHVDHAVGGMVTSTGTADPAARSAVVRLRDEVRRAKEALSADTDATIAVSLPGLQTEVRLTREELEGMIRPRVTQTVEALRRAVASTGLSMDDVGRVLLVGGSSRIPLVGLLVREMTGRPVAVDAHPKLAIAAGASIVGADALAPGIAVAEVGGAPAEPTADSTVSDAGERAGPGVAGLAGAAGLGFAATAGGAAALGVGGATTATAATTAATTAAAGTTAAAAGTPAAATTAAAAGPVGIAATAGPAGISSAAGPTGVSAAAGPAGVPTAAGPAGHRLTNTATKVTKARRMSKPIVAATAAGAAAAVAVVAVIATQGSHKSTPPAAKPPTSPTASPSVSVTPTSSPAVVAPVSSAPAALSSAPVTSPSATATGARGLTGLAAIVGGRLQDNSGKGIPGAATAVSLGQPRSVVVGPDGSIYVVDNSTVGRLLRIKDGQATVAYAGSSTGGAVGGLAVSPAGRVALLTRDGLLEITGDGTSTSISSLAKLGASVVPGTETPLAYDGAGNLYIANSNGYTVLRRAVDGAMSRVAGTGKFGPLSPPQGDGGLATAAPMSHMTAMVVDRNGDLLIGQAEGEVRMVAVDGTLSTIAGAGSMKVTNGVSTFPPDGTKATDVGLTEIDALTVDPQGRVYVGDSQAGVIVRINADGTVTFVAGDQSHTVDPTITGLPANQTRFADAYGLAFDKTGALLVAEADLVLKVDGVASA